MFNGVTFLLLMMFLIASECFPQAARPAVLYPFESGDKCGYINPLGKVVVLPQYDFCRLFDEGLAGVSRSGRIGYINSSGQLVVSLKYEGKFPESFSEGVATVEFLNANGTVEKGYTDRFGNFHPVTSATEVYSFHEGMAKVKKDGMFGYIDKSFRFVVPPQYTLAGGFADGLARVSSRAGDEFYIDKSGEVAIGGADLDGGDFSEGLAAFRDKHTGYGYIDTKGKVAIKAQFDFPCPFKEGLACAVANGKWGYIDKNGNYLIPPQFDEAGNFSSDGIATVKTGDRYGFINKSGEFIVAPQYDEAEWLGGLGRVVSGGTKLYVNTSGKTVLSIN